MDGRKARLLASRSLLYGRNAGIVYGGGRVEGGGEKVDLKRIQQEQVVIFTVRRA